MNITDLLRSPEEESLGVTLRQVPAQPAGTTEDLLYLGTDVGFAHWSGERPRPGETVVALSDGTVVAGSGQATAAMRAPLLGGVVCKCRCPSNAGLAFFLSFAKLTPVVHAIDGETGALTQLFGRAELGYPSDGGLSAVGLATVTASIAVDPDAPHDVYVLDDRRNYRQHDAFHPLPNPRGYFTVLRFAVMAGAYAFADAVNLTDPFPTTTPVSEPDLPAVPGNCLSLLSAGIPVVTVAAAPARYLKLMGGAYAMHSLTLDGLPYAAGLRGNVAQVRTKPANASRRYVVATPDDGVTWQVLEFDPTTDAISRIIVLDAPFPAKALATVCQRLVVIYGPQNSYGSTIEV